MRNLKKKIKNIKGITLISLVITVITLVILAGVTLAMVMGDNGIIAKVQLAKNRTDEAVEDEKEKLNSYEDKLYSIFDRSGKQNSNLKVFKVFVDGVETDHVPSKSDGYSFSSAQATNDVTVEFDSENWKIILGNVSSLETQVTLNFISSDTDMWATWLKLAKINPQRYSDLDDVLNDSSIIGTLFNSQDAINYLKQSTGILQPALIEKAKSSKKLQYYCSKACNIIQNSQYASTFDQGSTTVPTMTSLTSPSGTVISAGKVYESRAAWHAFGNGLMELVGSSTTEGMYVGYIFPNVEHLYKVTIKNRDGYVNETQFYQFKVQGSNDGTNWTDLSGTLTNGQLASGTSTYYLFYNEDYQQYRLLNVNSRTYSGTPRIGTDRIQFYCKDIVTE